MKKSISLILVLVLLLSMSTTALAVTVEENEGTAEGEVKASYNPGESGGTIISVDIEWNNLQFVYNGESQPVWDPSTHTYTGTATPAGWAASNATIAVTNHSNTFIEATLSYSSAADYEDASVVFGYPGGYYGCLVGNAANEMGDNGKGQPQTTTIQVVPTGFIPETDDEQKTIGTITIKIREYTYTPQEDYFASLIPNLRNKCNTANGLVKDPATLEYGTIYATAEAIKNASDKITAADMVVENDAKTDVERIQAINAAITALYSAYKIKQ